MAIRLKAEDLRGLSQLGVNATHGTTDLVEAVHAGIVGRLGLPTRNATRLRGISGFVYQCVRSITGAVGGGVDALLCALPPSQTAPDPNAEREAMLAVINGVLGEQLVAQANPLALPMQLRVQGRPLSLDRTAMAQTLPQATGRILILIHGLCMNDLQWQHRGHDYGAALAEDGYTALYLNYNSGLHISQNGRALAALLEQLLAAWPVAVSELVLLGHSMGGLAARSACHIAEQDGLAWRRALSKMVFLGTPHQGAPLEKIGNWLELLIGATPLTRPFKRLPSLRSAGITDLRHGQIRDEDWQGRDRFGHTPAPQTICPLADGVACYAVAARLAEAGTGGPDLLGDGLVRVTSAFGQHRQAGRRLAIPTAHCYLRHGLGHIDLLGDAEVLAQLRRWLGRTTA